MEYFIGQIFENEYPPEAATWCNETQLGHIEENPNGGYVIVENKPYIPTIQDQINSLEAEITPRRLREALLNNQESLQFISGIEERIEELRKQL